MGKLASTVPVRRLVVEEPAAQSFEPLPILGHHAAAVAELPALHRDPFDRLLVAQARSEGMKLLSCDPRIAAYEVEVLW